MHFNKKKKLNKKTDNVLLVFGISVVFMYYMNVPCDTTTPKNNSIIRSEGKTE